MCGSYLEQQIVDWHKRSFGEVPASRVYQKLLEEVGDLGEAIIAGNEDSVREEAGDVGFVLTVLISKLCPDSPSLASAVAEALEKNETRLAKRLAVKEISEHQEAAYSD